MFAYQLFSIAPHLFVQQFTPPVPLGLCLIAAGLAVLASFIVVGVFARNENMWANYPKFNLSRSEIVRAINISILSYAIRAL